MSVYSYLSSNLTKFFPGAAVAQAIPVCPASDMIKYDLINKVGVCLPEDVPFLYVRALDALQANLQAAFIGLSAIRNQAVEAATPYVTEAKLYVDEVVAPFVSQQAQNTQTFITENVVPYVSQQAGNAHTYVTENVVPFVQEQINACVADEVCTVASTAVLGAAATVAVVGTAYMLYSYVNSPRSLESLCAEQTKLTLEIADKQAQADKLNAEIANLSARQADVGAEISERLEPTKPADKNPSLSI